MRLPSYPEAKAWSLTGVPSCSNWTWTSSWACSGVCVWIGTSPDKVSNPEQGVKYPVRCVK